jgi:hypothetical protein
MGKQEVNLGPMSEGDIDRLIARGATIPDAGEHIDFLSERLLGTAYGEATLEGCAGSPEVFVINLEKVDCFTFIDYVEAMRLSATFAQFVTNLRRLRYRKGFVSFENRNHFFTDWKGSNRAFVADVTREIGGVMTKSVVKTLNRKEDGTCFLPGITPTERRIDYIPGQVVDGRLLARLKTGDYAGIYSPMAGLDVSHVGIIVAKGPVLKFRHASSLDAHRKVVDQDFREYMADKPGLIVLRPRDGP